MKKENPPENKISALQKRPSEPKELTDRQVYNTPIGPVCMSKAEHEEYVEEAELREKLQKEKLQNQTK